MADVVTVKQIQQWLESTKLSVTSIDGELENTAKNVVFSSLAESFDTTTWTTTSNTPALVQSVMSMLIAAWIYARAYSEDSTSPGSYSNWLESKAMALLNGIAAGTIDLVELPGFVTTNQPAFYPTDTSTEEDGTLIEAKFAMGKLF